MYGVQRNLEVRPRRTFYGELADKLSKTMN